MIIPTTQVLLYQTTPLLDGKTQEELINQASKITPYNPLGYAFLVVFLVVCVIICYRNWRAAEVYLKERDLKVLEFTKEQLQIIIRLESGLQEFKTNTGTMREVSARIEEIADRTDKLVKKCAELIDEIDHHKARR